MNRDNIDRFLRYLDAMFLQAEKRYSEEQANGDDISVSITRSRYLAVREIRNAAYHDLYK